MVRVTLLKNLKANNPLPPHTTNLDILSNKVQVPAEETTYWCHVHKLPPEFSAKHHVYQVLRGSILKVFHFTRQESF